MIVTVNSDYLLEQIDVCNGDVLCSLWGTYWILNYYLDELRFQTAIAINYEKLWRSAYEYY
jgi:hypothetical protein